MSFFKLAMRNVQGNLTNYLMYLISTTVAVMVFYSFYAIAFNKQFVALMFAHDSVAVAFITSAIIVAIFSVIFIWYSNSYFIRTRKKEFGTYSLLGMTKRQIARMIFYENFSLGLLSLLAGIVLGLIFSKLFGMLLVYAMGEQVNIKFQIVPQALETTGIVFLILFFVNALFGYALIYRFRLVELFRADKEGERLPKGSILATVIALSMVGSGYYLAWNHGRSIVLLAIPILLLVVPGTYILFNNGIVYLIGVLRRRKSSYYRGINLISISQLLFHIKGNARMLATIATLSAVTISAVGTSFTLYMGNSDITKVRDPFSLLYHDNPVVEKAVQQWLGSNPTMGVESIDHLSLLKGTAEVHGASRGPNTVSAYVMSASQYAQVVAHQGLDVVQSLPDQASCLANSAISAQGAHFLDQSGNLKLTAGNKTWQLTVTGRPIHNVLNQALAPFLTLVVPDQRFQEMLQAAPGDLVDLTGLMLKNPQRIAGIYDGLKAAGTSESLMPSSYYDDFLNNKLFFGILVYIGSFLGLIFFLSTGSIIYFKQLAEANDDRSRYLTLKQIGLSLRDIRYAVMKQLAVVFVLPLIVGVVHSFFALSSLRQLLSINILPYDIMVTVVYLVLYVLYYFVTVNSYVKIVGEQR